MNIFATLLVVLGTITPLPDTQFTPREPTPIERFQQLTPPREMDASCCKVCSKGYACGNSCISRNKQCHQPPGCAC